MTSIASPRLVPASGASTPTASSRRTSLDTNRTASPARAGAGSLNTPTSTGGGRRNRTALRDYYNLKPPSSATGVSPARASSIAEETSSIGSTADDESVAGAGGGGGVPTSELDAAGFDPSAYVARTLETEGLSGVLRAAGTLVNEIRELDGERKALVYDNYSKLIAATDTIRGMRANITSSTSATALAPGSSSHHLTSGNLTGLTSAATASLLSGSGADSGKPVTEELKRLVELVASTAQELASTAAGMKEEVRDGVEGDKSRQERDKKERARQTVRWVVESPARFRAYVRDGEAEKARVEWRDVVGLLDKWEGTEGVDEVRKGCQEALQSGDDSKENEEDEDEDEDESSDEEGEDNDNDTKTTTDKTVSPDQN